MLTWLSLIRAGYEVLLIAYVSVRIDLELDLRLTHDRPQSSPETISHLIRTSEAFAICYDSDHAELVLGALPLTAPAFSAIHKPIIQHLEVPWMSLQSLEKFHIEIPKGEEILCRRHLTGTIAYYFHSSGTTGLAKLIPQTHGGAVGILPKLQDDDNSNPRISAFTTTPLYHGGIADLLRSWSAASPLWLFPEGKVPIIGHTVAACIRRIDEIHQSQQYFAKSRLGYFSCVPYVLEALCEDPEVKERLCALDAVGVGGAAMPQELGDRLVADGMRLVSRFGSSECGFLLSSQRDYGTDKFWSALRCPNPRGIRFTSMSNVHHELVVTEDWPLVSTAIHAKRPFNTHDVFIVHGTVPLAWSYVGRSDSQLTLSTGQKFDPTFIEENLKQSNLIEDAVIVGDDKPFVAGIIFMSDMASLMRPDQRHEEIWLCVQKINESMPNHARLRKRSFRILAMEQYRRVRKNSKGGVIRATFLSDFEEELFYIYGFPKGNEDGITQICTGANLVAFITSIVQDACSIRQFHVEDDLFDCGIDSIMSMHIRKRICNAIPAKLRYRIPMNVVYQCSTIQSIARYISELLDEGMMPSWTQGHTDEKNLEMNGMVENYVSAQPEMLDYVLNHIAQEINGRSGHGIAVLLTGSTGFLGVHILNRLLQDERVSRIFLCTRESILVPYGEQQQSSKARVHSTLAFHNMHHNFQEQWERKMVYVPILLRKSCLGIPPSLYNRLISETTHVVHAAWEVNFNLPLKTFAAQIEGTINLFNLALLASQCCKNKQEHCTTSFLFCSSVASTANMPRTEQGSSYSIVSKDSHHAANLGYGQSKWVTENILERLSHQYPELSVSILRIGQLSGDTLHGIWNLREAWPLMIETSLRAFDGNNDLAANDKGAPHTQTCVFPDLAATTLPPLDWLPVNYAAEHIWRALEMAPEPRHLRVLKIANEDTEAMISWNQAQDWIVTWAESQGLHIKVITPSEWLHRLENSSTEHQAKALLSLWRQNWLTEKTKPTVNSKPELCDGEAPREETTQYPSSATRREDENFTERHGLEKAYFCRILDWIARNS
jgi:thioester reductase-like protein/acyl-coenzyme A synthetase/AMP-(fatty) acid ligase